jgi:hypothetical protein
MLGDAIGTIGTELIAGDFVGAWDTAISGITAAWDSFVAGILETMAALVAKIGELWDGAVAVIRGSLGAVRAIVNVNLGPGKIKDSLNAVLGGADAAVTTGGTLGSIGLGIASAGANVVSASANAREAQSRDAFNRRIAGGADKAGAAADDLGKRLDDLTNQAGAARARAAERFAAESPAAGLADQVKTSVSGSFSAAALIAFGQGAKTGVEQIAGEQLKEQKKLVTKIDEQIRVTTRLERALTVA